MDGGAGKGVKRTLHRKRQDAAQKRILNFFRAGENKNSEYDAVRIGRRTLLSFGLKAYLLGPVRYLKVEAELAGGAGKVPWYPNA